MACKRKNCECVGVDRRKNDPPGMKVIACFDGKPTAQDKAELRKMMWYVHDRRRRSPARGRTQEEAINRIRAKAGLVTKRRTTR